MTRPLAALLASGLTDLLGRLDLGDALEFAGRHEEARRCRDMALDVWVEGGLVAARARPRTARPGGF
jgi:hypothetical protein